MSAVLDVRAVKRLGSFTLDVAFAAPKGITALFGASGAGKTQTLRAVAGLMRPDQGRIVLAGRTLLDDAAGVDLPARERRTGYVFQHYALFPHLDVRRNVGFGLAGWSATERDARVEELLGLVGLQELARRTPAELSGGQQQRVALARALAPRPDLLLLDEPFSALDALVRGQLRRELRRLQTETGVPMLLVTHDLAEVRLLADHLVLMGAGRALQAGATEAVLSGPATPEAAALLEAAG